MNLGKEFKNYGVKHLGISSTTLDSYIENSMTPYILEEREMRVTQMDIFSRLMRDRIIWLAGVVDDRMSTIAQAQLMFLDNLDSGRDITLHVDSPGGSVKSGLSIVDTMEWISSDVQTVNTGMCASMGSVILAAGTKGKRASLRFSKVMTHQVSHGTQGNVQDTRINQMEAEKYNYILFNMLADYSGKTFDEVLEFSRRDRWYSSQEALDFGLIDEVIVPEGGKSIDDLLKGFEKYYKKEVLNS